MMYKWTRSMMRILLSILIIIFIVPLYESAYAESITEPYEIYAFGNGTSVYTIDELLTKYKTYSTTYKGNMLQYKIDALSGSIADEGYSELNFRYTDISQSISELLDAKNQLISYRDALIALMNQPADPEEADDTDEADYLAQINEINTQIDSIDLQLQQYNNSKSTLELNLAEAKLQEDITDFYFNYEALLTKEAHNILINDFKKKCYSLILYKEQLESELSYQDYLDMVLKTDMIRYEHGLVEQLTIDKDNTSINQNALAIGKSQNAYDVVYQNIKNDTGITDDSQFSFMLYNTPKSYDIDLLTIQFMENNSSYHQLQNYIRSYQYFLGSAGTNSYSVYKQTELRIEDYQLKHKKLEENIKAFVKAAINSYDTAFQEKEVALKELLLKSKKYDITRLKLDYKRASKLELQQALFEKEVAEVNYIKWCYEIIIWQDIIDNNIYGASTNTPM